MVSRTLIFPKEECMKKVLLAVLVFVSLLLATQVFAAPWAIVATSPDVSVTTSTTSIHTIDLGKKPPVVYGPFLEGQIITDTSDSIFDIVMLPDKKHALASTFGTKQVHRIDLKNPKSPVKKGTVTLDNGVVSMFAEDIAVTPDGKLALVSDGGFSPTIAFIDAKNFTLTSMVTVTSTTELTPTVLSAQAVAIAPDNKTVLLADYFAGKVHYGTINAARNGFDTMKSLWLCDTEVITTTCTGNLARPVNIAISPDGKTALVAISSAGSADGSVDFNDLVVVLEIKGTGNVVPGVPFFLHGLPGTIYSDTYTGPKGSGNQSIAFRDKKQAYVVSQRTEVGGSLTNQLSSIRILGPGWAAVEDPGMADLFWDGSSQFFGVDVLAISKEKVVVGHPTLSGTLDDNLNCVAYVNLKTGTTTCLHLNNRAQPLSIVIK
jgi:hypothetical protein